MASKAATKPGPPSARAERTHQALVAAGQEIFAEQGVDVAVKTITDTAGVGLGSFYNHFERKCHLHEAACLDADAQLTEHLRARVGEIEDPAERFCARLRLYIECDEDLPTIAKLLSASDAREVVNPKGYEEDLRADLDEALETGRLKCEKPDVALDVITAASWTLLQSRTSRLSWAGVEASEVTEKLTYFMTLVGMPDAEARKMARACRK